MKHALMESTTAPLLIAALSIAAKQSMELLELVHSDVCGKISGTSSPS